MPAKRRGSARQSSDLGDSWIVDDAEVNSMAGSTASLRSDTTPTQRRRAPRKGSRASAEPELIMPSIYEDSPRRRQSPKQQQAASPRQRKQGWQSSDAPRSSVASVAQPILVYALDVLGGALKTLKTPISYALAVWLLFGMMILARNLLFNSIYSALSPVCRIPGISLLGLEICKNPVSGRYTGDSGPPVEFGQVMSTQSQFEGILEQTAHGVGLPADMKHSEASMRDLRTVIRYSSLKSRNELDLEFDGFIKTARIASFDLQRFSSRVGGAVDIVLSTTRWTQRVLAGIEERKGEQSAVANFISSKLLAPFQPLKFSEDALLEQYLQHMRVVKGEIRRLLGEAQALVAVLANLEDRLEVIHGIAMRDGLAANVARDELLGQLWTMVGGNRSKLGNVESQLRFLGQMNMIRKNAFAQISGTILQLQKMDTELTELGDRVSTAEILGERKEVPLAVHLESIQLGAERLEARRLEQRGLENEYQRGVLDARAERGKLESNFAEIDG